MKCQEYLGPNEIKSIMILRFWPSEHFVLLLLSLPAINTNWIKLQCVPKNKKIKATAPKKSQKRDQIKTLECETWPICCPSFGWEFLQAG